MYKVYADNAATTQPSKAAIEAALKCMNSHWGNPSSLHSAGREAAEVVGGARRSIVKTINGGKGTLYFTSGGTEADNWALNIAAALGRQKRKFHIISTAIEHHAILKPLDALKASGFRITLIPVDSSGVVNPHDIASAITDDTIMVSAMYANNEIGTIQPVKEIGMICKEKGALFHTDAVQAVGRIKIDAVDENIDLLSLSAHKFHGTKGAGALYCSENVFVNQFIVGGNQEQGKRAGTENVPAIASMAAALEDEAANMLENNKKIISLCKNLTDFFVSELGCKVNGDLQKKLPGIVNFTFDKVESEPFLIMLDLAGICASSGAACSSGAIEPSHVLLALGAAKEEAKNSVRFSLSCYNTEDDIDYIIKTVPPIIEKLKKNR